MGRETDRRKGRERGLETNPQRVIVKNSTAVLNPNTTSWNQHSGVSVTPAAENWVGISLRLAIHVVGGKD
jgi:hypothetical protein